MFTNKHKIILALIVSLTISISTLISASHILKKKNIIYEKEEDLSELKGKNAQLKEEYAYTQSEDYVLNEARDKFNYTYPGEKVVIVQQSEEVSDKSSKDNDNYEDTPNQSLANLTKPVFKQWLEVFF